MTKTRKIKKDFKYRDLGGKTIDIEYTISNFDIVKKLSEGDWICYNFIDRRPDFDAWFTHTLYYGKVDGMSYIISEDELE